MVEKISDSAYFVVNDLYNHYQIERYNPVLATQTISTNDFEDIEIQPLKKNIYQKETEKENRESVKEA